MRAAASGPLPSAATPTVSTRTGASPSAVQVAAAAATTSADPCWRPWSTSTAPARRPARGATKAVAAASASESGPPLTATSTSEPGGRSASARRTAVRPRATAGSGPVTGER
ncbi:hypothetical protein GCM10025868_29520 [Angustibacter aerolatus]|uniref:Uncharacterized protein n=1 Tax=Angustibacter aerolatus TaxID=1162965 RepID=A0ABQ6JHJ4_9ACTN|nr:hypothetical protein GCM10025868_29520 [Angustibacter aerolatus]